jgi:hypothetical protein
MLDGAFTNPQYGRGMKLLADRGFGGISVRLFWDDGAPPDTEIVLEYEDSQEGVAYTLYPPRDRALDAFYHPNAYAWLGWAQTA